MATKKGASKTTVKKPYRFELVVEYDVSKCLPQDIVEEVAQMVKEYNGHGCAKLERAVLITGAEIDFLQ